jgi:glycosyltransferase involved in cell wall biosynthesis
VFLNALPAVLRSAGRVVLAPYYRMAERACRGASALAAVSQTYLDWGLRLAGRRRGPHDLVVPLGFEPESVPRAVLDEKVARLRDRGIDPHHTTCLFAGLLERSYDLETVVDAARRLEAAGKHELQFIICGDGSKAAAIRRRAQGMRHVHLLGWVDAATLQAAASISAIGLCAYAADALQSLPNKPFEYMSGRLALASSLSGELAELIERHQCGLTYQAGDVGSCSEVLSRLSGNRALLDTMRSNAHRTWVRHYGNDEIYGRFADNLTSMVVAARAA